jgi:phosphorylcholine metabolism protein LicD
MLKAYTDTMDKIGVQTWIMHGCLLGWWWGRGLMPWDKDLDFLVEEEGARELGTWWNMTVHHFDARDLGLESVSDHKEGYIKQGGDLLDSEKHYEDEDTRSKRLVWEKDIKTNGKKYLIEVNPNYTNKSTTDVYNHIDIRWIDVSNGLYIDITTIHVAPVQHSLTDSPYSSTHPSAHETDPDAFDTETQLYVKDTHAYLSTQLFPLRQSTFEGVKVKVPYAYEELLLEEYGSDALTEDWYNGYQFDKESRQWKKQREPSEEQKEYFQEKNGKDVGRLSSTGRIGHGWRGQGAIEGVMKEEGVEVDMKDVEGGRWTE